MPTLVQLQLAVFAWLVKLGKPALGFSKGRHPDARHPP